MTEDKKELPQWEEAYFQLGQVEFEKMMDKFNDVVELRAIICTEMKQSNAYRRQSEVYNIRHKEATGKANSLVKDLESYVKRLDKGVEMANVEAYVNSLEARAQAVSKTLTGMYLSTCDKSEKDRAFNNKIRDCIRMLEPSIYNENPINRSKHAQSRGQVANQGA